MIRQDKNRPGCKLLHGKHLSQAFFQLDCVTNFDSVFHFRLSNASDIKTQTFRSNIINSFRKIVWIYSRFYTVKMIKDNFDTSWKPSLRFQIASPLNKTPVLPITYQDMQVLNKVLCRKHGQCLWDIRYRWHKDVSFSLFRVRSQHCMFHSSRVVGFHDSCRFAVFLRYSQSCAEAL